MDTLSTDFYLQMDKLSGVNSPVPRTPPLLEANLLIEQIINEWRKFREKQRD